MAADSPGTGNDNHYHHVLAYSLWRNAMVCGGSMERDYVALVAALRRKAADKGVTTEESKALTAKANELAKEHGIIESKRNAYNGQVPTWEEFREYFNQQAHETQFTTRPKPDPTDPPFMTRTEWHFIYIVKSDWLISLDEDTSQNGNYEFPQEENFSE